MEDKILRQIIIQIKKYDLVGVFKTKDFFESWLSGLNPKQIDNFLSLDIDTHEVELKYFKGILIDRNLLSCQDYTKRVEAISKLKNCDGYCHLFSSICNPRFLESKSFYKDIEMISRADTAKYGLMAIEKDLFMASPYHDEDLKLIVEAKDIATAEALVEVASDIYSINSPYHQKDMLLISKADIELISSQYTGEGLEYLATNEDSLKDKYHLENMQILAQETNANELLFRIMTTSRFIKGKYYRKEVEALRVAKSRMNAIALYYYIVNPIYKFFNDSYYTSNLPNELYDILKSSPRIFDRNLVSGNNDRDYLNNLVRINNIDEKFVMHYTALLMDPRFINSQYKDFDLKVLEGITDIGIFMDLYTLIYDGLDLVDNSHHKSDVIMLSGIVDSKVRKWLIRRMISRHDNNYDYDIEYIMRLKLDSISDEIKEEMKYYLFLERGINDPKHKDKLECLLKGILVEREESLLDYLNELEKELDSKIGIPSVERKEVIKGKSRILKLFKSDKRNT